MSPYKETLALFIDGANLYATTKSLGFDIDYNGYTVVTKPTKEFVDQVGRRKIKGNMDIELAVDAMELAGQIDHMVLFSGDGVRVTVVSSTWTQPPMIAD